MIYLDHHAATPLAPNVCEAIARAHAEAWANPESVHRQGRAARALREAVRAQVAMVLGAAPADVVLAGTGTEALNLALLGVARARRAEGGQRKIVTTSVEHPGLLAAVDQLEREGFESVRLSPLGARPFAPAALARELSADSACVAIQWVNHETGNILPIAAYAAVCRERGVPLVVDACQALGKLPIDVASLGVSALVVAAAKVGGPAGVSALWHARGQPLAPVLHGGAQERGFRPGTPDVGALAGFGAALEGLAGRLATCARIEALRARIEAGALALGGLANGAEGARVATVSNVSFRGYRADFLVAALDVEGLSVSAGAACSSGLGAPSPVLRALYPDEPWRAESALRFSLGPETHAAEVEQALSILAQVLARSGPGARRA